MCTLTWHIADGGYDVCFNRDERIDRGVEVPASRIKLGQTEVIAPRDSDFGGSWIATNEHGLTVCVLNGYAESVGEERVSYESRGQLVLTLAELPELAMVLSWLKPAALRAYRPFVLGLFTPEVPTPTVVEWNGESVELDRAATCPIVSSSFDRESALTKRAAEFARLTEPTGASAAVLATFHSSHTNGPSTDSTCMHHEDAATRSYCHVRVDATEVRLAHFHGALCEQPASTEISLARRPAGQQA